LPLHQAATRRANNTGGDGGIGGESEKYQQSRQLAKAAVSWQPKWRRGVMLRE
jgi:hypothetical protein